jgi:PKD repeat protein
VRLTGIVGGVAVTDSAVVNSGVGAVSVTRFLNLEPATYDLELRGIQTPPCEPGVTSADDIAVDELDVDSVSFSIFCEVAQQGLPISGTWLRDGAPVNVVGVGSEVVLRLVAQIPDTTSLASVDARLTWDPGVLAFVSAVDYDAGSQDELDTFTGNVAPGRLTMNNVGVRASTGSVGIADVTFTALAEGPVIAGMTVTEALTFDDLGGQPIELGANIPRLSIALQGSPTPPVARPGGPYSGTVGTPVAFDGRASSDPDGGSIQKWIWRFGDLTAADSTTGAQPTHTYASAAPYTVQLIVVDDEGVRDTASVAATITSTGTPRTLYGRWTNTQGTSITQIAVGDTAVLNYCTNVNAVSFSGRMSFSATVASLVSVVDLNSATSTLPACAGSVDVLNQFTGNPSLTSPYFFTTVATSTTGNTFNVGVARARFRTIVIGVM